MFGDAASMRQPRAARWGLVLLIAAAAINLGVGVALALGDPDRASDLRVMYDWCRAWLIDGRSLYIGPDAAADYPPNAIVLLSPIALVPERWLVPLWTAGSVLLAPVLPWLVLRTVSSRGAVTRAVPALLFLCWAAPRTLLQFSMLSMTLACAALFVAKERDRAAGVALGLALFKPHIAGPIALWMLLTGRIRSLVTAGAVVLAGWVLYDARIGESPLATAAGWWHVIGSEYAGPAGLVGHTSIRGWALMISGDPATADVLWIVASAALLAAVWWVARRSSSDALDAGGIPALAVFCLWSLLVTYHNGNNMILMLPAFAFLWFRGGEQSPAMHWIPIVAMQCAMAFDVPVRLGHAAAGTGWARTAIEHFDRGFVLTTLIYVSACSVSVTRKFRRVPTIASAGGAQSRR
jgi:hypothetical protein